MEANCELESFLVKISEGDNCSSRLLGWDKLALVLLLM